MAARHESPDTVYLRRSSIGQEPGLNHQLIKVQESTTEQGVGIDAARIDFNLNDVQRGEGGHPWDRDEKTGA